ncbi:MAG: NAD(P)/FAD-dependent oxidoreductase [Candidatus Micrarchaeaceae archaeon]
MNENSYDVIVAGSGMGGSLAAAMAARNGAKTLLLDRNDIETAGKKTNWGWVCGDAVAESHLKYIRENAKGLSFDYPELDKKVDGVLALSPDLESKFIFEGEGYVLNRPVFERKLVEYAIKNGVEYVPKFEVEGPILEGNKVVGVFGKDKDTSHAKYYAKVVVDALGIATTLRRKLPENDYIDRMIDIDDVESTGRYIYSFEPDHEDPRYYDPKNAIIHLNQHIAPGGYGWVFPKKGNRVNIGLGVQKRSLEVRNKKLNRNDTLHTLMDQYVESNPVIKKVKLDNENMNGKGYWSVAVRRQMESLVYPGYLGVGDSMAMPNPISAGGIGPALVSGILGGINAARAASENEANLDVLWKYNLDFNEEYGKKTAGLEAFRVYLQSLNNDLLNYGMKMFITEEEAVDLSYGRIPELSLASKFKIALKGAANIRAFSNLLYTVRKMKVFDELYKKYPKTPKGFVEWKHKVQEEMHEVKEKFKPNPV